MNTACFIDEGKVPCFLVVVDFRLSRKLFSLDLFSLPGCDNKSSPSYLLSDISLPLARFHEDVSNTKFTEHSVVLYPIWLTT